MFLSFNCLTKYHINIIDFLEKKCFSYNIHLRRKYTPNTRNIIYRQDNIIDMFIIYTVCIKIHLKNLGADSSHQSKDKCPFKHTSENVSFLNFEF